MNTEHEQPKTLNKLPPGDYSGLVPPVPTPRGASQPKVGVVKHPPFDPTEAIRMYQMVPRPKMSLIVEAVRGPRAAGATGNLIRDALRKAGLYEEPVRGA